MNPTTSIEAWLPLLANFGVAGFVIWWLTFRGERRLLAIENAQNRSARAILLLVVKLGRVGDATTSEATGILREIDRAERRDTPESN